MSLRELFALEDRQMTALADTRRKLEAARREYAAEQRLLALPRMETLRSLVS